MIKEIIDNMSEKLGENKDLIADDIANLLQYENETSFTLTQKEEEINSLKSRNDTLTQVNANLLKSVPLTTEKIKEPLPNEEKETYSFRSCFDEKGNFIK